MEHGDTSSESSLSSLESDDDDTVVPYHRTNNNNARKGLKPNLNIPSERTSVQEANKQVVPKPKGNTQRRKYCKQCPFSTLYLCDLRRHLQRHIDVKFPCLECNMPFLTLGHLNGHKESVHGEKRISDKRVWRQCDKCVYRTRNSSDVSKHRKRHELAVAHCEYCNKPFCHLGRLKEHIRRDHENEDQPTEHDKIKHVVKEKTKKKEAVQRSGDNQNEVSCDNYTTERKAHRPLVSNSRHSIEKLKSERETTHTSKQCQHRSDCRHAKETKAKKKKRKSRKEHHKFIANAGDVDNKRIKVSDDASSVTVSISDESRIGERKRCESEDLRQNVKCVFCDFETLSYNELNKHLDEHDIVLLSDGNRNAYEEMESEYDKEDTNTRNSRISNLSDNTLDSDGEDMSLCTEETEESEIVTADDQVEGSNIMADTTNKMNEIEDDISEEDNDDVDINKSADSDNIFRLCVSQIETESTDEFLKKPFACAKCYFKTGSLDYLKIHVEAHLFETARAQAYYRRVTNS